MDAQEGHEGWTRGTEVGPRLLVVRRPSSIECLCRSPRAHRPAVGGAVMDVVWSLIWFFAFLATICSGRYVAGVGLG